MYQECTKVGGRYLQGNRVRERRITLPEWFPTARRSRERQAIFQLHHQHPIFTAMWDFDNETAICDSLAQVISMFEDAPSCAGKRTFDRTEQG